MLNSTTNTYQMKREIFNFLNKIFKHLSKPYKKFSADMTYGMLAAGSCLLTDVVDQLHKDAKKVNSIERLTKHLTNGTLCINILSYPKQKKKLASLLKKIILFIDSIILHTPIFFVSINSNMYLRRNILPSFCLLICYRII